MKIYTLLKPINLLMFMLIIQLFIYILYLFSIIPSYRINYISDNYLGYFHLFTLYIVLFTILIINRNKTPRKIKVEIFDKKILLRMSILITLFTTVYMVVGFKDIFINGSFNSIYEIFVQGQQGGLKKFKEDGSGLTLIHIFYILSNILLVLLISVRKSKKYIALILINFLMIFILSTLLMARFILVQSIIIPLVLYLRLTNTIFTSIKVKYIIGAFILLFFLFLTSGIRDYEDIGYKYTDTSLSWGFSRITDYFISTFNYTVEALGTHIDFSTFPKGIIGILSYFQDSNIDYIANVWNDRNVYAAIDYTNLGSFTTIYNSAYFFTPFFMILLALLYNYFWNGFISGNLTKIIIYPVFLYNILETTRVFFLGSVAGNIWIITLLLFLVFIRRYIRIVKDE
ncbi:O-antigen polymerase [Gracilibacillus massiliensis]|uniref:O-antigen polymerase n=1 Tax=Gracilibacillus massiliensis TaxID=1564956 RepID=UPI00071C8024|nr:O-antigen polymerase [Gracilibacillus massiliensis]